MTFLENMRKFIAEYRRKLRRLSQPKRMSILRRLNLNDDNLYQNELAMYYAGKAIVSDVEQNLSRLGSSNYHYSGVEHFVQHLKTFLNAYVIENNRLVHRSQKASTALVEAIQLLNMLDFHPKFQEKMLQSNTMIASYGSSEQHALYKTTLRNAMHTKKGSHGSFCRFLLDNFQEKLQSEGESTSN